MQYFKGDETEIKMSEVAKGTLDDLSVQKDLFWEGAFEAAPLGDIIFESNRSPLANAITQAIFRDSFPEIYEAFRAGGSFEAYISVFQKIFGEDVEITFTVPAPGKLEIDIIAAGIVLDDLVARAIEDNHYVLEEVVDYDGDNIALQSIKGFQSQYELEQMLFEMVPAGIFTEISLTLGE